jgi:hypothetical protein
VISQSEESAVKTFFGRFIALYLGLGLIVRIVTGGALLSLGTLTTMIVWPFVVVGWIVKLAVAVLVLAALYWIARGWLATRAR